MQQFRYDLTIVHKQLKQYVFSPFPAVQVHNNTVPASSANLQCKCSASASAAGEYTGEQNRSNKPERATETTAAL